MFTGIIEERGTLTRAANGSSGSAEIFITCSEVLQGTKTGDSICVNGICLTATTITKHGFTAHAAQETLQRSTLASITAGNGVNLERALTLQTRLGGHLVAGHVDTTAQLVSKTTIGQSQTLRFALKDDQFAKYIVEKGSIAIDGISLTVTMVAGGTFEVVVIPHTQKNTTLEGMAVGRSANIETDIIARYAEKLMHAQLTKVDSGGSNNNNSSNNSSDGSISTLLGLL